MRKKSEGKKIMHENLMLKDKIINSKTSVNRDEIMKHQEKIDSNKRILMLSSPSQLRLYPLVHKHLKNKVSTNSNNNIECY
ncbi:MAG: hypothetical protein ACK56F_06580, partial [bacterium]